jgi:hypothetical protein
MSLVLIAAVAMCAPPKASESAYALSGDEAVSIICAPQYAWDCETALAITWRESRWQPTATNPYSGAAGIWQIHPIHRQPLSVSFDPEAATAFAYQLYMERGWQPWRVQ